MACPCRNRKPARDLLPSRCQCGAVHLVVGLRKRNALAHPNEGAKKRPSPNEERRTHPINMCANASDLAVCRRSRSEIDRRAEAVCCACAARASAAQQTAPPHPCFLFAFLRHFCAQTNRVTDGRQGDKRSLSHCIKRDAPLTHTVQRERSDGLSLSNDRSASGRGSISTSSLLFFFFSDRRWLDKSWSVPRSEYARAAWGRPGPADDDNPYAAESLASLPPL